MSSCLQLEGTKVFFWLFKFVISTLCAFPARKYASPPQEKFPVCQVQYFKNVTRGATDSFSIFNMGYYVGQTTSGYLAFFLFNRRKNFN